ncbi:hypothetical protein [Chakrabartyella piscis]|uniref:hypothetical protein n=1 Tax=Chakrabartyella piscis TaxID=2918914 RepID=UPI00295891BE|nr:hypothetical protein [Chakrabartyella piscis]
MKKFFAVMTAMMAIFIFMIVQAEEAFLISEDSGYAVSTSAGIVQSLSSGSNETKDLARIEYEDIIYETISGYYVGEDRVAIDIDYPMYINGGAVLRFFEEGNWLITPEVILQETYDGLYVANGDSYNKGMEQTDSNEEFILLALDNGLYMNVQASVFTTRMESHEIPSNSILYFDESVFRWYSYSAGRLTYGEEEKVFDATLAIGENVYDYASLLDALGLIREAIELQEKGQNTDDLQEEAYLVLNKGKTIKKSNTEEKFNQYEVSLEEINGELADNSSGGNGASVQKDVDSDIESQESIYTITGERAQYDGAAELDDDDAEINVEEGDKNDDDDNEDSDDDDSDDSDESDNENDDSEESDNDLESDSDSDDDSDEDSDDDFDDSDDDSDASDDSDESDDDDDDDEEDDDDDDDDDDDSDDDDDDDDSDDSDNETDKGDSTGGNSDGSGNSGGEGEGEGEEGEELEGEEGEDEGGLVVPEDSENDSESSSGGTTGGGADTEFVYTIPTIKFGNLDVWSYATGAKLHIFDPSATIISGVSIVVYKSLDRDAAVTTEYTDPYTGVVYTAYNGEIFSGKTALASKNYRSDAEFALGELPIDSTVYIQYSYSYYLEEDVPVLDEEGNDTGEVTSTRSRVSVKSDLIEVTTTGIEEVSIVNADWTENFAASSSGISLTNLTMANSTDYDADLEDFSFENYKLNCVSFLTSMKLTVTDQYGEEQTLSVPYSTLAKAKENPTSYLSTNPALASNSVYTYTAQGYDKNSNAFPMQISVDGGVTYVDESEFEGTFYTQKEKPTASISEVENVADKLTIQIAISDPDGAIATGSSLFLSAQSTQGVDSALYGYGDTTVSDQTTLDTSKTFGGGDTYEIELADAKDGAVYTLRIESLDFAKFYTLSIDGTYDPTPDRAPEGLSLDTVSTSFGSFLVYTKALTYGSVSFDTTITSQDTYGSITATMNSNSTTELVELVDEFIFEVKEISTGVVVESYTLLASELNNGVLFNFDEEDSKYTVTVDKEETGDFAISFTGTGAQFNGKDLWEALCISYNSDTEKYSSPITLNVDIDEGTLKTSTQYSISITSNVIKSNATTEVTTNLSNSTFYTKKLIPTIEIDDIFLSSEYLNVLDLLVYDPDGTIINEQVQVLLYYGSICLYSDFISANAQTERTAYYDIEIDGLIEGEEYELVLVAPSYKDTIDSTVTEINKELWSRTCVAGGNLNGDISLTSVDYTDRADKINHLITISGEEAMLGIANSADPTNSDNSNHDWHYYNSQYYATYDTPVYDLQDDLGVSYQDLAYIYVPDYRPDYDIDNPYYIDDGGTTRMTSYIYVRFYKDDGKGGYTYVSTQSTYVLGGRIPMIDVPHWSSSYDEITGISFYIPDAYAFDDTVAEKYQESYLSKYGFTAYYIKQSEVSDIDMLELSGGSVSDGASGVHGGTFSAFQLPDSTTGILASNSTYGTLNMIPVTPGDWYTRNYSGYYGEVDSWISGKSYSEASSTIRFFSEDGAYVGYHADAANNSLLIIPEGVYYMSVPQYTNSTNASWGSMMKIFDGNSDTSDYFGATVSTYVNYEGSSSRVPDEITFTLQNSDSMELPIYSDYRSISFPLTINEDQTDAYDGLSLYSLQLSEDEEKSLQQLFTDLTASDGWRIKITTEYQGNDVSLDYIDFRTDMVYRTIRSSGDMRVVSCHHMLNYLIIDDFTFNLKNYNTTFSGVLDAQGHVVTVDDSSSVRSFVYSNFGTIKNIVYDIPAGAYSDTYGGFCYNNYGKIDNIILRTLGDVTIEYYADSLLCTTNQIDGTISNFIVALGGNATVAQTTSITSGTAVAIRYNRGVVENGYMYSQNAGEGVRLYPGEGINTTYASGLVGYNEYGGIIQNIYTDYDLWIASEAIGTMGSAWVRYTAANTESMYHVGEMYEYVSGFGITYTKLDAMRLVSSRSSMSVMDNLWFVSDNLYSRNAVTDTDTEDFISQTGIAQLYNIEWQESILGDHFDVEESINMGFYPRLNTLPISMQKYQEYRYLPSLDGESAPIPLEDSMVEYNREVDDTTARIQVNFQNESRATITGVSIDNLTVVDVVSTTRNDDGFYEVVIDVAIDPENEEYISEYVLESVIYTLNNKTYVSYPDYTLTNVSMWKGISEVSGWTAMNNEMSWNYFLKNDLDFTGTVVGNIVINGSLTSLTSNTTFKGALDGNGYTLENIKMENTAAPWVFANLYSAEIFDLNIDNMYISSTSKATYGQSGFIRYSSSHGNLIDNVHVTNSTLIGGGNMGMIIGQSGNELVIKNCSVTDSTINDISSSYAASVGGIIGYYTGERVSNCFTRNVDITINESSIVSSVGGLIGSGSYSSAYNCYTHGTISATGSYIGGIMGRDGETRNCWSYVTMDVDGNYVGGVSGYADTRPINVLSVGDIVSTGSDAHRIVGLASSTSVQYPWYSNSTSYNMQNVSNVGSGEVDDAKQLVSTTGLIEYSTWTDIIMLDDEWNYDNMHLTVKESQIVDTEEDTEEDTEVDTEVSSDVYYFPFVYSTKLDENGNRQLVLNQELIQMPGQVEEPSMTIERTLWDNTSTSAPYQLRFLLEYPGLTATEVEALITNEDGSINTDALYITGMDMTNATVYVQTSGDQIQVDITTSEYTLALDSYRFVLNYDIGGVEKEFISTLYYERTDGTPFIPYHEIGSLSQWNDIFSADEGIHQISSENFKITGMIDFEEGSTIYSGLKLGRLEGSASDGSVGFKNLNYYAGTDGNAWIDTVTNVMKDLTFIDISGDFSGTTSTRSRTGMILYTNGLENINLSGIKLKSNNYSANYLGFVSYLQGDMTNINISPDLSNADNNSESGFGVYIDLSATTSTGYYYIGGVAAYQYGSMVDITASNITVFSSNKCQYIGGIVGSQYNTSAYSNSNINVEDVTIYAYNAAGAVSGYYLSVSTDINVSNSYINTQLGAAGVAYVTSGSMTNVVVDNVTITGYYTGNTTGGYGKGGAFGTVNSGSYTMSNIVVKNSIIEGTCDLGGIFGRQYNLYIRDSQVIDTDITALSQSGKTYTYASAGGIVGYDWSSTRLYENLTVRNVNVTGHNHTGGILGWKYSNAVSMERIYIAEDVTVTSNIGSAGGLVGLAEYVDISSIAIGADVNSLTSYAGGLIGNVSSANTTSVSIANSYYTGDVMSSVAAGGVIGYIADGTCVEEITSVAVNANVMSTGTSVSPTVNHSSKENAANEIYVFEDTTLNGVRLSSSIAMPGITAQTYIATNSTLVDGDWFKNAGNYQSIGFDESNWYFAHMSDEDNAYMPFVLTDTEVEVEDGEDAVSAQILPYSNKIENPDYVAGGSEEQYLSVGILLPAAGGVEEDLAVYASGVNTINIEVKLDDDETTEEITIASGETVVTYKAEEVRGSTSNSDSGYAVLTVAYDFADEFTVSYDGGSGTYAASDLARDVMSYGNYWYYVSDAEDTKGDIVFGNASSVYTMEEHEDEPTIIHMWQGKALADDGTIYSLSNAMTEYGSGGENQWGQVATTPFYTTASNGYALTNYYNFTIYGGSLVSDNRLYVQTTGTALVSNKQNAVYDGVQFTYHTSSKLTYYGLLIDNAFVDMTGNMILGSLATSGIDHISNSLGYSETVVAVRYESGAVAVVNYYTGTILSSTVTLSDYVQGVVANILSSMISSGDEVLGEAEDVFNQLDESDYASNALNDVEGTSYENGISYADGTAQGGDDDSELEEATTGTTAATIESGADDADNGTNSGSGYEGAVDDEEATGTIEFNSGVKATIVSSDGSTLVTENSTNSEGSDAESASDGDNNSGNASTDEKDATIFDETVDETDEDSLETTSSDEEEKDLGTIGEGDEETATGEYEEIPEEMLSSDVDDMSSAGEELSENSTTSSAANVVITGINYPETAIYDAQEQTLATDLGVLKIEDASYVPGEGVYVADELIYMEAGTFTTPEGTQRVELISTEQQYEAILESLGEFVMVYNVDAQGYEKVKTATLLNNASKHTTSIDDEEEEALQVDNEDEDGFAVNKGWVKTLSQMEKSGFTLLFFILLASIVVLAVIYFKVKKRE